MPNTLTHPPSQIVQNLLIGEGLGVRAAVGNETNWPVFYSKEPSSPDNCITVYDTTGKSGGRSMIDGELLGHEGIQLQIRSQTYLGGWNKSNSLQRFLAQGALRKVVHVPVNTDNNLSAADYLVHCFSNISDVLKLGLEVPTAKRSLFTINTLVTVKMLVL